MPAVNAGARLDRLPISSFHYRIFWLVGAGMFFDGYDLYVGTAVLPALLQSKFSTLPLNAQFVSFTFLGMTIGALVTGFLGDRYGRRFTYQFNLMIFGLASLAAAFAPDITTLNALRFVMGLGLGAEIVVGYSTLTEFVPPASRGRWLAFMAFLVVSGLPVTTLLGNLIIPSFGWRPMFVIAGVGALIVWYLRKALPESPRWLEAHGRALEADEITSKIERRVARDLGTRVPEMRAPAAAPTHRPDKTMSLWTPPYRRRTIVLITFHLFQTIGYFGFANWLPTLLVSQGVEIGKSLAYSAVVALVPPAAPLVFSLFVDRVERKWMVAAGALLAAVAGLLLSRITQHSNFALFTVIGAGVAIGNSLMSMSYHTYQSELFPTPMRARAVGFVYSFSRLSAIFSGYIIAATLDHAGSAGVFILISTSMVIVALTISLFGPRTRGLALEEI
jgi:putative MFS transporter